MPHPAEHRALRELHVFGRQLVRHWETLGRRLGGPDAGLLAAGAADARGALDDVAAVAAARGDGELSAVCAAGAERLGSREGGLREAIVALGARPDEAVAPAVPS